MPAIAEFADLCGKSALITGGGSGIGAALTEAFLHQHSKVAFLQRSDGAEFCRRMELATGSRPICVRGDVTEIHCLEAAVETVTDAFGGIDVLVNNAANDARHRAEAVSEADWNASHAVNLRHYFFAARYVSDGMRGRGNGSIINFSSTSYMMGASGLPAYVCANAGIAGLTRALAREFGPDNIRVNAIAPGWVLTDRQLRLRATPEKLADQLAKQSLKEHLKPADIAGACLFLASAASRMMTGQVIVVDGGVVTTG